MRVTVRARADRDHLQLAYTDPLTGAVRTKSAETANWDDAQRAAAKWESQLAAYRGTDCDWSAFRTRFEDEYLPDVRPNTAIAYMTALRQFEKHIGVVRSVRSIDSAVCSTFSARLRAAKLATPTIAKHLRHLRAALRWAESVGILERAPRVVMPKLGNHRPARGRPLTETEFGNMLQAVPDGPHRHAWQQFLRCLWLSGLRVSEALSLSWSDPPVRLDLTAKTPCIVFGAAGHKANRAQQVPITPDFRDLVAATPLRSRSGLVFPLPTTDSTHASRTIADLGRAADIRISATRHASAHDLRRSFGTRWAMRVHPMTLRALMRHTTIQTTLAYYVDIDIDRIGADLYHSPLENPQKTTRKPSE